MGNFRTLWKKKNYFKKQSRYKRQTKQQKQQRSKRQKYPQSGDLIYIQINYYLEVRVK